jgi:hypothetical protein
MISVEKRARLLAVRSFSLLHVPSELTTAATKATKASLNDLPITRSTMARSKAFARRGKKKDSDNDKEEAEAEENTETFLLDPSLGDVLERLIHAIDLLASKHTKSSRAWHLRASLHGRVSYSWTKTISRL